jgi:putative ABC transport system permease protein
VRALEVTVDASLLWVGVSLAMVAAIVLAYIPRLPSTHAATGLGLAAGSVRITSGTNRRLRAFAMTQIAFSFVLLAGAGTLVAALVALQTAETGYNLRQVLAFDLPTDGLAIRNAQELAFYEDMTARVGKLPGVAGAALGNVVPWRDAERSPKLQIAVEGYTPADGEQYPYARMRIVAPRFFSVLGVPVIAGREFTEDDRSDRELVVIVSQSVAQRLFPNGDALNRKLLWTGPLFAKNQQPRRIVGIVADVDDENVVRGPAMTVYHPTQQVRVAGRLFVHATGDPYALVPPITKIIRDMSANQPVERAATLEDVRSEVLAPERLNAFVLSGFAGVALLIAVVGVAGVLAFSVSARTREFGIRLAVGSAPRHLLIRVLLEGAVIVAVGIAAGAAGGYAFARFADGLVENVRLPGAVPIVTAAAVLVGAGILASLMPAARASRVDVLQALRSE